MFLPKVLPALPFKFALWFAVGALPVLNSTCYGQNSKESIPSAAISSKEQSPQAPSTDKVIDKAIDKEGLKDSFSPSFSTNPIPEYISVNLLNSLDPIPLSPFSFHVGSGMQTHTVATDEGAFRIFVDNLPKPYLRVSSKNAKNFSSFGTETALAEKGKTKEQNVKSYKPAKQKKNVDLMEVFAAAPWIYSILGILWVYAFFLGFYNLRTIRRSLKGNEPFIKSIIPKIEGHEFEEIYFQYEKDAKLLPRLIATSISCRSWGLPAMLDHMKGEGRRFTQTIWHRIGTLSDVAMIAPLLGLLGTVIGMFYAFNDVSRSANSLLQFMDGLGVSIGTTVAGLLVAISAICFQSICRDQLARATVRVEQHALDLARLIDRKSGS